MDEIKEQPETVIACILEDNIGYWGAGATGHGDALSYHENPEFPYYIPKDLKDTRFDKFERTMMTNTGRLCSIKEAWQICEKHNLMIMPVEDIINLVGEKNLTSVPFEKAFNTLGDIERAQKYVDAHNMTLEKTLLQKYPRTFMEKYEATKGQGD
jgi:hypothetical protein